MDYLILITIVILCAGQTVASALYGKKKDGSVFMYAALSALTAMIFFLCYNKFAFVLDSHTVVCSLLFALAWVICSIASLKAMAYGSVALTSMLSSFSLLLPTLFGILYWKEGVKLTFFVGLVLFCVCVVLVNLKKKENSDEKETKKRTALLWVICVTLMFFSNGACSIIQTFHQKTGGSDFKAEFMIIALSAVFVTNILLSAATLKKKTLACVKLTAPYAVAYGVMNAVVNLGVMLMASSGVIASSVFFPIISIGSLILVFAISLFGFKERFERGQYVGIVLGIAAIVLLQI